MKKKASCESQKHPYSVPRLCYLSCGCVILEKDGESRRGVKE
ncbi:hypothetical protein CLOHYLEM_05723 [[Clostridium] hylemonae DSM 15053]|uniref:Uncharacterized protein n=1 Tax=[Clostridium] hylemonae DSM 15053 TaxID=553973 RepID=C0C264_9FIRM|nr:hypothetical protein CLOHYLEM_05723 [[Clostridium] hylemonae DSM 15053]